MNPYREEGIIDIVIDTDTYNEIDDQFAVSYALKGRDRVELKALYAAPFLNSKSTSPADGMEKSYNEIVKLLRLAGREDLLGETYRGSTVYLPDEKTPVDSPAARDLAKRAARYTKEHPLYVVTIGAITNVASALLMDPSIADKCVIVWMGGHARHWPDTNEFNMMQDVAAARVVFSSGARLVQLPGMGVTSEARTNKQELEHWLVGKNPLATYLAQNAINEAESYASGKAWTRVIWDICAMGFLMDESITRGERVKVRLPEYDNTYSAKEEENEMLYIYWVDRDRLFTDLFTRLAEE